MAAGVGFFSLMPDLSACEGVRRVWRSPAAARQNALLRNAGLLAIGAQASLLPLAPALGMLQ